jgi:predicted Fe-Mo cluster-binding NifX family protein
MKVCFPVQKNEGINSLVYNHFGSAPMFIVVDTDTDNVSLINNRDQHHAHGACNPIKALDRQSVDAIVVGGIGAGALSRLNQAGIKVYQAKDKTIKNNVEMFKSQSLPELKPEHCCGGHSHGGGTPKSL